jgi:hypothetical protein
MKSQVVKPLRPSFIRRVGFRLAALCLSSIVSLMLLEGAVRVLGLAPPLPESYRDFVEDPYLPFKKKPNVVRKGTSKSGEFEYEYRYNAQGFRDAEHALKKPDGLFRILGLGDSFAFGVGAPYPQTYLVRLETLLNNRPGNHPQVEIVKAGVPRYYPEIERLQLEHYGIKYDPDLVLAAFLPNDVLNTFMGLGNVGVSAKWGYLVSKANESLGSTAMWFYVHSHVARSIIRIHLDRLVATSKKRPGAARHMSKKEFLDSLNRMATEFERMVAIAERRNAQVVLVCIPQVNLDPLWGKRWAEWAVRQRIPLVNVQPALSRTRTKTGKLLFWPVDGHCDPDGYEVIAKAVAQYLDENGLVP